MIRLKYLTLVALAALLLGACSNTAEPTAAQTPTPEPPTATSRPATRTPTQEPTLPPTAETESGRASPTTPSAQKATDSPTPTPDTSFLNVRPNDWVRGPDDAAVTIIEYSDFQ